MNRIPPLTWILLLAAVGCRGPQGNDTGTSRYPKPIPTAESGPVLFSPGYVSSGLAERDASFSPGGEVFAFTQLEGQDGTIVLLERGVPAVAPFSGRYSDLEPFFDPRGGWLWFASQRPHPDDATRADWNIWRVATGDEGWGEPELVRGLDGPGDEFYPTVSLDGTVAFTAERAGGLGGEDIWLARQDEAGTWTIENAGAAVNGPTPEFNALLTPDGNTLVFSSVRPDDPRDQGGGDLYLSTRAGGAAGWTEAAPLAAYNSPALDYCPAVTPDGRYLVFTSRRTIEPAADEPEDFPHLRARLAGPGNGNDDLWWALMPGAPAPSEP